MRPRAAGRSRGRSTRPHGAGQPTGGAATHHRRELPRVRRSLVNARAADGIRERERTDAPALDSRGAPMTRVALPRLGALALLGLFVQRASAPSTPAASVERVATLHDARAAHTATALRSGQVLIVGGMAAGGGSLAGVELSDPPASTVRQLGPLDAPRVGHTATLLPDGRVLIAGGYDGEYLRSLELFDPSSESVRPAGALVE